MVLEGIRNKLQSKQRGRVGPEESDLKEIRILNRIVTWISDAILFEADQRNVNVEIFLQEMRLEDMNNPAQSLWTCMKRLLMNLMGAPRAVLHFGYQHEPKAFVTWTDSDSAGCHKSRKWTSAGVIQFGTHLVMSWLTNQAVIALSSGESQYFAPVKAGS